MENTDQGNKAKCEAIQNLTTCIVCLQQIPQSQQRRESEESNRKYRAQPKTVNSRQCRKCLQSNPDGNSGHCYKCRMKNATASTSKIEILYFPAEYTEKADLLSLGAPLTGKQQQQQGWRGRNV